MPSHLEPFGDRKMEEIEFKFSVDWTKNAFYCGLDVHKYELAVAVYGADESLSEFVRTNIFSVDSNGLEQFWNFVKKFQPYAFAMEATGIYHHIIYKFLQSKRLTIRWPFKILVVNPADAAGLPGRQKHDRIDAENLAKYLAKGLLKKGKPVIEVLEDLKAIFRMAAHLERDRTALKNRIKKTLDRAGIRPRYLDLNIQWVLHFLYHFIDQEAPLGGFIQAIMKEEHPLEPIRSKIKKRLPHFLPYFEFSLTSAQRALIRQDLIELDFKTGRKSVLAIEIDQILLELPALREKAHHLASTPGISPFSAVWILAETGHIKQFPSLNQFRAYCGCCPRVISSAGKVYSAHTSRHSNAYLRTIFYNAAVVVCNLVKKESTLKEYADRVSKRKISRNKKLVYCIVAGKIAKIVYAILRDNVPFNPEHGKHIIINETIPTENKFTVVDRKTMRRARNTLRRVNDIQDIGVLGEYAENLAEQLDKVLIQGKNFSD